MSVHVQHLPPTPIPTTEPKLVCHPQSFLPMVEPPVTPRVSNAVDSKGVTPWVPSPRGIPSDSQGPSQHAGGQARARQSVWEREGSPGDSRAGRPQAPCSPSLPMLQLGRGGGPDSCLELWLLWALERPGPGRCPWR